MSYKLHEGDCCKILQSFENESIDCIITDPPYGIDKEGIQNDSGLHVFYAALPELYRVLKQNSFFICFSSIGNLPKFFKNNPFDYRWQFITYINNGMVRGSLGFNRYISTLVFQKGDAKLKQNHLDVMEVSTSAKECSKRKHPTQKRIDVLERLIRQFTDENDIILDPFLGSGATMFACQNTHRNCVGIEINPEYCKTIKKWCFERRFLDRENEFEYTKNQPTIFNFT